jgi:hypothetical protein
MNIYSFFVLILLLWPSCCVFSQGFVNMDFESAVIRPHTGGAYPNSVFAANAIPGWTAYISGLSQTDLVYNDVPLGDAWVTLQGTNNIVGYPPIQGKYFMMLWGQFNPSQNNTSTNTAAIGQTGQIPLASRTLTFWGLLGGMQTSFAGQPLNFIQMGSTANYNIYAADITAFAGQTGQLLFTDPNWANNVGGPSMLDNIQFSTSPIPEPSAVALTAIGSLLLAWRCRRRLLS